MTATLRDALTSQGFEPVDLHLEPDEAAVLFSLLNLGMDAWTAKPVDIATFMRLDRLPDEAFTGLARKIIGGCDTAFANVKENGADSAQ